MKKQLTIKHFKNIVNQLKKIKRVDGETMDLLIKSYSKNYLSNTKTHSIITLDEPTLKFKLIASYSFETEDYKLDRLNAKYITIRFYYMDYDNNHLNNGYGKHRIIKKRYYLG